MWHNQIKEATLSCVFIFQLQGNSRRAYWNAKYKEKNFQSFVKTILMK